jgi:predicted membrane channel-forming protein YqfA (hemolysin III family)
MYHCTDALNISGLYLTPTQWHKLDNIGAILVIITVLIYLMDNLHYNSLGEPESCDEGRLDRHLTYSAVGLTLLMQTKDPWDIFNTYFPILTFLLIFFVSLLQRRPRFNVAMLWKGLSLLGLAIVFFVLGLDDANDYLRIWHGLWHATISVSLFYLLQAIDKDKPHSQIQLARLHKIERFSLWSVVRHVFLLQFLKSKLTRAK